MNFFPTKDPAELVVLEFDFSADLGSETLATVEQVTASVIQGDDADPAAVLYGAPALSGNSVTHTVRAGTAGVNYKIKVQVGTDAGRVLVLSGVLPVRVL